MSKTSTVRARVEARLKIEVEEILSELGLTASEAIHILYRQIRLRGDLPFETRLPNALTEQTLRASKARRTIKRFATKADLYRDIGL
jgi:DNA-damage-inducible protein J